VTDAAAAYPLLDAAAARAGDQAAVDAGDTWAGLMERAGGHLARGVVAAAGRAYGLRVAVLVGKGNNGGDGWVAARRLAALGPRPGWWPSTAWTSRYPARPPRTAHGGAPAAGGRPPASTTSIARWRGATSPSTRCSGTGVSGAPRGPAGQAAAALLAGPTMPGDGGRLRRPVGLSVDDGTHPTAPSGPT
jgi:ADP-dependent NAD(P)H-hydrate dehydratase / NAD(P)H-hydrate epimerase